MSQADKRRLIAVVSGLGAMPFFFFCGFSHICFHGHFGHAPLPWYDIANDLVWLVLLTVSGVFALRSNISGRWVFVPLIVVMLWLRFQEDAILSMLLAGVFSWIAVRNIRSSAGERRTESKEGATRKQTGISPEAELLIQKQKH
ncbi:MAG: hypothetical protein ACLFUS_12950 [Candidatus Sumerlaeia bacterium]